jgi:hypothetical protein
MLRIIRQVMRNVEIRETFEYFGEIDETYIGRK